MLPDLNPCFPGQLDVRLYPYADDDEVSRELPVPELHALDAPFAGELIDLLARVDVDAVGSASSASTFSETSGP